MLGNLMRRWALLVLGLVFLGSGLSLLGIGLYTYYDDSEPQAQPIHPKDRPVYWSIDLPVTTPYNNLPGGTGGVGVYNDKPPLRMIIESIDVDAPVIILGVDENNVPQVPLTGYEVTWYNFSAKPGQGSNAVFSGHVTWDRGPAVFWKLNEVQPGDSIRLITKDGKVLVYQVFNNFYVDPNDPNATKVMYPTDRDVLTLITCGGTWLPNPSEPFGGEYTHRTIVRAKLLTASVGALAP
ncbi:MAG: class F sortase [Chloroflexi bacterium]|nr:class F sortase [Chloroflexota bacterium]